MQLLSPNNIVAFAKEIKLFSKIPHKTWLSHGVASYVDCLDAFERAE